MCMAPRAPMLPCAHCRLDSAGFCGGNPRNLQTKPTVSSRLVHLAPLSSQSPRTFPRESDVQSILSGGLPSDAVVCWALVCTVSL